MDPDDAIDAFDQTQANKEGWGFFSADRGFELQAIDSQDDPDGAQFDGGDVQAWDFVVTQAKAGSAYHQEALTLLERSNPGERDAIRKARGY